MSVKGRLFVGFALTPVFLLFYFAVPVWKISKPRPGEPSPVTSYMKARNVGGSRPFVSLESLSPFSVCAIIKSEDRNFFRHFGFDWAQLRRAAGFLLSGNPTMGGSTITQQLARNLFLTPERTWSRKIQEAFYAFWLEARFSKEEILALYLNTIEWGEGTWGIFAAAERYFSKKPDDLNLFEAIFLTALVPNPRATKEARWGSIEKISMRVAQQLYFSEYISSRRMKELRDYLEAARTRDYPLSLSAPEVSFTGGERYRDDECGLSAEIRNSDNAKKGRPLEIDPRYFAKSVFLAQNPNIAGISPDGEKILLKSMNASDFTLIVRDRKTGRTLFSDTRAGTQLSPTWSPNSRQIAYGYSDDRSQRYYLCVMDPAAKARRCSATSVFDGSPLIRWSPQGDSLAVTSPSRDHLGKTLTFFSAGNFGKGEAPVSLFEKAGFDWSPDGKFVAVVLRDSPGSITVLERAGGSAKTIAVGGQCRSIHWGNSGEKILATCRRAGAEYFELFEVERKLSAVHKIAGLAADIIWPIRVAPDSILFHANIDGENKMFLKKSARAPSGFGPREGHSTVAAISSDRSTAYVLNVGRTHPARMLAVSLRTRKEKEVAATPMEARLQPVSSRRLNLKTEDGARVPAYWWAARGRKRAGIVLIHGGPQIQTPRYWNSAVQALANQGAEVIAVNFRGSSGYGASYEKEATVDAQALDVTAAIEFLRTQSAIPLRKIILVAHSYGTQVALGLLSHSIWDDLTVFFRGFIPGPAFSAPRKPERVKIFQGEWDWVFPPQRLERLFKGQGITIEVIPGEGHQFDRVDSQAQFFGAVGNAILAMDLPK